MPSTRINASYFLIIAIGVTVALMALAGCGPEAAGVSPTSTANVVSVGSRIETPDGAYTNLKPSELKQMLENKSFFLVDVHTPHEGRLPKTDARVVFDQVEQNISTFPADKGAQIVVTCQTGSMSAEASKTLVRLGYTNVYNLDGGMVAWKAAGYELIPEDR
ncbi:MAG TPA: rhodanese-like domain-containing protein [Chloroflexia bacterium]|nr:rhodanese-like domain-containing protein [Chloroflexia bacterium]